MKSKRKVYEEKLDSQMNTWNAQIELLKAKAVKAKSDVEIKYNKNVVALHRKRTDVKTNLWELKSVSDETWAVLKSGAEKAWTDVKTVYRGVSSRFK
jgi:hypothetical protein